MSNDELVDLYNMADFFVYPSIYEGFGLPILEAMASHAPVITSNISPMTEVAGDAALLVNPLDDKDLETKILKLAHDTELKHNLIQCYI